MAQARLEIILNIGGTRWTLDTSGVDTVPITFNVQDIRDITSTQGSYSKSIVIPETPHNRMVFNNITDLNSNSSFDPNLRNRAYILVDSQMIMEGYFQLTEFTIDKNLHKNGLTLVVFSDNNDFYTLLNEDFLVGNDNPNLDLDLSNINHKWNIDDIRASWGTPSAIPGGGITYADRDYTWGYYYPLIDYGWDWSLSDINGTNTTYKKLSNGTKVIDQFAEVQIDQMFPAIYARVIWDDIFKGVGFKWKSESLPLIGFNDLIIPFNNTIITRSTKQLHQSIFRASISTAKSIYLPKDYWFSQWNQYTNDRQDEGYVDATIQSNNITTTTTVPFNDTTTDPNGDPNNLWNTTDFHYTNTTGEPQKISFGFDIQVKNLWFYTTGTIPSFRIFTNDLAYAHNNPQTYNATVDGYEFRIDTDSPNLYSETSTDNGWTLNKQATVFGLKGDVIDISGLPLNGFQYWHKKFMSDEIVLQAGSKVWVVYNYTMLGTGYATHIFPYYTNYSYLGYDYVYQAPAPHWWSNDPAPIFRINAGTKIAEIQIGSFIFSQSDSNVIPYQTIDMNTIIPQQVKKRDFILSIIKMFNLVVEPDKDNPRTLNIETRDYYYSHGKLKDWSKKIDLNDEMSTIVIGDTQNKRIILKYKDDKDYYNDYYTKSYNQSFGQYIFNNPNQFVVGDNVMELQFSPTPITTLGKTFLDTSVAGATVSNIIIPKIEFLDNNSVKTGTSNMRILYKKWVGLTASDNWYINYSGYTASHSGIKQYGYPYAGYLDDPYYPTKDLNYGQVYPAFKETNTTINTLYYAYWKQQLEEMVDKDSRILTASFYLTPEDIVDFRFSDTIFLDFGDGGQYYRVNKITDYDPSNIVTCKVELFRTKHVTVPKPITLPVVPASKPTKIKLTPWKPSPAWKNYNNIYDSNNVVNGVDNNVNFGPSFINGDWNSIAAQNTITNGGHNTINSNSTFTHGDYNTTYNDVSDSFIAGDYNTIQGGSFVTIFGSNNKVMPIAGSPKPENVVIIGNNQRVSEPNRIQLAQPTILVNNWVLAGKDEILNMFSENSIINYISSGRDAVRDWGAQNNINIASAGRDDLLYDNNTLPIAKSPYTPYY